jgi:hypothetical protein
MQVSLPRGSQRSGWKGCGSFRRRSLARYAAELASRLTREFTHMGDGDGVCTVHSTAQRYGWHWQAGPVKWSPGDTSIVAADVPCLLPRPPAPDPNPICCAVSLRLRPAPFLVSGSQKLDVTAPHSGLHILQPSVPDLAERPPHHARCCTCTQQALHLSESQLSITDGSHATGSAEPLQQWRGEGRRRRRKPRALQGREEAAVGQVRGRDPRPVEEDAGVAGHVRHPRGGRPRVRPRRAHAPRRQGQDQLP